MEKNYDNKMLKSEEAPKTEAKKVTRTYHFASEGFTVVASTLAEANKALEDYKKSKNTKD